MNSSLEKKRLRDLHKDLVRRFVTNELADDVLKSGFSIGERCVCGTVLFCDMRGFTSLVETLAPEESLELITVYHTLMFEAITSNGGVVTQIVGDGLMALFGVPTAIPEPALAVARAGVEMTEMIPLLNADRAIEGLLPVEIGIGITAGDMIAGEGVQERPHNSLHTSSNYLVIATSTLQGACSISAGELDPRHHRAAQPSRCL